MDYGGFTAPYLALARSDFCHPLNARCYISQTLNHVVSSDLSSPSTPAISFVWRNIIGKPLKWVMADAWYWCGEKSSIYFASPHNELVTPNNRCDLGFLYSLIWLKKPLAYDTTNKWSAIITQQRPKYSHQYFIDQAQAGDGKICIFHYAVEDLAPKFRISTIPEVLRPPSVLNARIYIRCT